MLISLGLDLVEVPRIRTLLERHGSRFTARTFTEGERAYCDACADPAIHYAARFAAKEAVAKALGTGFAEGVSWLDIEVMRDGKGGPSVQLHGAAGVLAKSLGVTRVLLTLTHTKEMAAASVAATG